ncbi:hybrid sensor histidine kinase/response regulator transcription factor [Alkalitalea saponilacus]|uniref:histidine kinase n=1 Tax=Alkalitalea saponilacus TaxID=889453 RepID=A0A1T5F9E5_9BACT|nr:two-component regulator propeller domain-containing protein [Alkalitalea saponilacus]ASB50111.1 hybrid sensor histidine kinase/response regulator [Alkalitalea saponilacus]SKB92764.1 Signal transduction histidine kinase [Alkalitalea saponilacus]
MGKNIFCIIVFLLSIIKIQGQQAANQFRRIDSESGLSNNQINTIHADSRGFLWFATVSGLNRYDGHSFRVFKNIPGDHTSIPENSIHEIYEDHLGYLWLFTGISTFSIYNPKTESFGTDHELFSKNISLPRTYINTIRVDADSNVWICNDQMGLYYYHRRSDYLQRLYHHPEESTSISSDRVKDVRFSNNGKAYVLHANGLVDVLDTEALQVVETIEAGGDFIVSEAGRVLKLFLDSDDDIWIYSNNTPDGLFYINQKSGETRHFLPSRQPNSISSRSVSGVLEDSQGRIWLGTDHGGINIIDKNDFSITLIEHVPGDVTSLSGNSITSLEKSGEGIIWVGTFKNGINYSHDHLFQFDLYRSQHFETDRFFSNDVNCFTEDSKGNLWIGTNGNGLVYYDRNLGAFTTYRHNPANPNSLSSDIIVSLFNDHNDDLWIGTYQGGLNRFDGQRFHHFRHDVFNAASLSDDRVWNILRDSQNRLWVATLGGGLSLYDERSGGFIHHREDDYNSVGGDYVLTLFEDSRGSLWIGTSTGVTVLDGTTQRFRQYMYNGEYESGLSNNSVLSFAEDLKGRIWLGTRNGLNLYNRETRTFKVFREEDGLPDHNIISMQIDEQGNLWIATLNGLSSLTLNNEEDVYVFRNYDLLDGLQGLEFNEHSTLRTSNGELIFGGANGFNLFNPEKVIDHHQQFSVILTEFRLFNRPIAIGENIGGRTILNKALNQSGEISLRHNQNVFSIEFSGLNYFHPERTRFRYKLDGFNQDWIETDSRNRIATYTNLNPGTYTFKVKAMGSDGSWSTDETHLDIVVIPPFYATSLAYIIYLIFFILLIGSLIWIIKRREKMKFLREQERSDYQRSREMDAMKLRFFTNVSHEFRTPLTLILSPLDKLLKEIKDENLYAQLTMVQRNARRLLNLVNQILDFRKIEADKASLNLTYGDLSRFLEDAFNSFRDLFENKNVRYDFKCKVKNYYANFDFDKMEKIVFNLLSNALKFTHENGIVSMIVVTYKPGDAGYSDRFNNREYIEFSVADTGVGISADKHEKIFERFYQSTDDLEIANQGSGIGLALTLEFVKIHGGTIEVKSEKGKGSKFIVRLPLDTSVPDDSHQDDVLTDETLEENQNGVASVQSLSATKPEVLLVEDNEDLRSYLRCNLKEQYEVSEAANGQIAWNKILESPPHLIVSDIMMPVEDGIQLCKRIKGDPRTSHIPVILLTAKVSSQQKIEGLEAGAEDYITKPFNFDVLELKIKRLIELRLSFQKIFSKKFEIKPGEIGITSLDEKFLNKALKVVEKNIGNSEFSVEKMGRELGVSRGHLYNKLVALTDKTPVEFIRIMRLKRAAQLLGKSQLTVSEIAFQVGFNDPKYFSKYFKEEFGMVPSEYAKSNQ